MSEKKNTYVIGIDGMQGSGKSQQLELLAKSYAEAGAQVLICKGSGSRTGTGEVSPFFYNPINNYRQDFHMRHYTDNTSNDLLGPIEDREQATSILHQELIDILGMQQYDIILLDRTILTIYSLALQKDNTIGFHKAMSYYEKKYSFVPYLPDSLIALIVDDTKILEQRIKNRGTHTLVKQEILKKTPDFMYAVNQFNNDLSQCTNFAIIDCTVTKDQVHQTIIKRLNTVPGNPFVLQSQNISI